MKNISIIAILLAIVALSSCKKDDFKRYDVDQTLDPYLQMFLEEGRKRGVNLNVERDGLILEFHKLQSPTIGLCTYVDPLLVQIDPDYWQETTQYEDQENLRQNVVFHELGHGLLNRKHDNSLLPNSEWKSIMCGGDQVPGRDWSINFNGYRKEYYINELFNIQTPAPDWSQPQQFDGEKGVLIAETDLSKDFIDEDENYTYQISGNTYIITAKGRSYGMIYFFNNLRIKEDFYFETSMKYNPTSEMSPVGPMAFYDYDNDGIFQFKERTRERPVNDGANYLDIFPSQEGDMFFLVNSNCGIPIAQITQTGCYKRGQFNTIAIARRKGELFYYVNNQLVFRNDYQADKSYIAFGFVLSKTGVVEINSARLYYSGDELRSSKEVIRTTPTIRCDLPAKLHSTIKLEYGKK